MLLLFLGKLAPGNTGLARLHLPMNLSTSASRFLSKSLEDQLKSRIYYAPLSERWRAGFGRGAGLKSEAMLGEQSADDFLGLGF